MFWSKMRQNVDVFSLKRSEVWWHQCVWFCCKESCFVMAISHLVVIKCTAQFIFKMESLWGRLETWLRKLMKHSMKHVNLTDLLNWNTKSFWFKDVVWRQEIAILHILSIGSMRSIQCDLRVGMVTKKKDMEMAKKKHCIHLFALRIVMIRPLHNPYVKKDCLIHRTK